MKHIVSTLILATATLLSTDVSAQAPTGFTYQAVVRSADGLAVSSSDVGLRLTIRQTSAFGTAIYSELHTIEADEKGLVSLTVGNGTTSEDFSSIDWAAGPYFLQTEIDPAGGSSYSMESTQQLLSVPYALYAERTGSGNTLDDAYDEGGAGAGRTIVADNGRVTIAGTDGLRVEGVSSAATGVDAVVLKIRDNRTTTGNQVNYVMGISRQNSNTESMYLGNDPNGNAVLAANNNDIRIGRDFSGTFTERMRIKNNGNVGIGTNDPLETLHVVGTFRLNNGSEANGKVLTSNASGLATWSDPPEFNCAWTMSGNNQHHALSGNVGIGTSEPSAKLEVVGSGNANRFKVGTEVGSAETVVADGSGRLGIGTALPKSRVHVSNGDVYVEQSARGVILKSGNGTCFRMRVGTDGTLSTVSVTCP